MRVGGQEAWGVTWAGQVLAFGLLGEHLGHGSDNATDCPNRLKEPFSFHKHLAYCQGRAYEAS